MTVLRTFLESSLHFHTPLFYLTVLNFILFFFKQQNRKINEDSKNVLKTIIFSLQVGFIGDFVTDYPFKLCFGSSNFDTAFLPDCTQFCSGFLGY